MMERSRSHLVLVRQPADPPRSTGVRQQAASVRALLDEIEHATAQAPDDPMNAELVEELARLGCRCLELAGGLAAQTRREPARPSIGLRPRLRR